MNLNALSGAWEDVRSSRWGVPAFLFVLTALAYGPLIPVLGFYWDDWPVINMVRNDSDLWSFYAYDRPFSAWTYVLAGPLLGIRPIGWHLAALVFRWLTTVGLWWSFKQIWPNHRANVLSAAALFAVYPSFTLQPLAVAFSQHLVTYALFTFSIGAMLAAWRHPDRRVRFSLLAVSLQIGHLLTMEYFWGLELVRPVLLWALPAAAAAGKERIRDAAWAWLPYLAVYAGFLAWRMFIFDPPGQDPNALALLELYRADPLAGLLHSFNIVARDLIHMVYKVWTTGLGPSLVDATDLFLIASWGWAVLAGAWTLLILAVRRGPARFGAGPASFYVRAIPIGAFALVVSLLPSWMTDNEITAGMFSSRFSLPAMAGSSLFLTGLFDLVLRRTRYKHILIAVLVCLAAGVHLRSANDFRWAWIKQERFFRQLTQRAPDLLDGTAVFSDGAIFPYTASYPTASALNTIYPLQVEYPQQSYWFFELDDDFPDQVDRFDRDIAIEARLRNLWFAGSSLEGLVIFYEPDTGSCLRVLEPDLAGLPFLPELTAAAAPVSNPARIRTGAAFDSEALDLVFGAPEPTGWCDLFQQAELSRQRADWDAVLKLLEQAAELGLEPNERLEWFVFIEARVRTGDWAGARSLILDRLFDPALPQDLAYICSVWSRIAPDDPTDVRDQIGCPNFSTP